MEAVNNTVTLEPFPIRVLLILITFIFVGIFLVAPIALIFSEALSQGFSTFSETVSDPDTQAAIRLTLFAALIAVPANTIFGLFAAWLLTRFRFWGRSLLITIIDLPLSISPVVAGLMLILLFGSSGWFYPLLEKFGIKIIFNTWGIILATMFITVPFVVRELLPLMESLGTSEEEAAVTMGAGGFQTFVNVTLPNIKWGLLYGIILCNSRAMGEFGAVSVVSGHIRGETNTLPLHVEILYNEYNFAAAFAAASLLAILAIATLLIKTALDFKYSFKRKAVK